MDRQKRKANLKKLQNPSNTVSKNLRSGTGPRTPSAKDTKISEFFITPKKSQNVDDMLSNSPSNEPPEDNENEINEEAISVETNDLENKPKRPKRTKLTNFIYKNKEDIPEKNLIFKRLSVNDFEPVEKKVKKAPQLKTTKTNTKSRSKKQQTLKNAFLRNEQIFSEIAAQHCIAENFSPDDMQIALAMSKSEAEAQGMVYESTDNDVVEIIDIDHNDVSHNESIHSKLQKYGFRTCAKEEYSKIAAALIPGCNRRTKSKWANKFTALTLRNPEYQSKKAHDKIEVFLQNHNQYDVISNDIDSNTPLLPYRFLSKGLNKVFIEDKRLKIIYSGDSERVENTLAKYFVKDLFPISEVRAGYLLKNWKAIQGRDLSPQKSNAKMKEKAKILEDLYKDLETIFNQITDVEEENNESTQNQNKITKPGIFFQTNNKIQGPQTICTTTDPASMKVNQFCADREESCNNDTDSNELDAMIELIEKLPEDKENFKFKEAANTSLCPKTNCISPLKVPPDKRSKLSDTQNGHSLIAFQKRLKLNSDITEKISQTCSEQHSSLITFIDESLLKNTSNETSDLPEISLSDQCKEQFRNISLKMSGNKNENNETDFFTQSTQQRSHSPDIFADSDEAEDEVEARLGITTYETYSSDEVKNSSKIKLISSKTTTGKNTEAIVVEMPSNLKSSIVGTDLSENNTSDEISIVENIKEFEVPKIQSFYLDNKTEVMSEEIFDLTDDTPPNENLSKSYIGNMKHTNNISLPNTSFNLKISQETIESSNNIIDLSSNENKSVFSEVLDLNKNSPPLHDNEANLNINKNNDIEIDMRILEREKISPHSTFAEIYDKFRKKNANFDSSYSTDNEILTEIDNGGPIANLLEFESEKDFDIEDDAVTHNRRKCGKLPLNNDYLFWKTDEKKDANKRKSISMSQFEIEQVLNKSKSALTFNKSSTSLNDNSLIGELQVSIIERTKLKRNYSFTPQPRGSGNLISSDILKSPLHKKISSSEKNLNSLSTLLDLKKFSNTKSCNSISSDISIDLTQDEDEETEEDDVNCIMLSDDEINYSIWKANKSIFENDHDESNLHRLHISFENTDEEVQQSFDNKYNLKESEGSCEEKDYSLLNLLNHKPDMELSESTKKGASKTKILGRHYTDMNLDDEDDMEPLFCEYLLSPSKEKEILEHSSTSTGVKERQQFGILDSYSESLNLSQIESIEINPEPIQVDNGLENWVEASFFQSPSEGIIVPPKRKSDRFDKLLEILSNEELNYKDEFDLLVSEGLKKSESKDRTRVKTPTDFDQLLTGHISFNADSSREIEILKCSPTKSPEKKVKKKKSFNFTSPRNNYLDGTINESNSGISDVFIIPDKQREKIKSLQTSPHLEKSPLKTNVSPVNQNFYIPQDLVVNDRIYTVRIVRDEKPNYNEFSEAELLKLLYKFGIKPLKRKQAVKLLEYIYNQTHPVLLPEENGNSNTNYITPSKAKNWDISNNQKEKYGKNNWDRDHNLELSCNNNGDKIIKLKDCYGHEILRYKDELFALLVDGDEEYIFQTNITKKTPQPLLPFHIAWHNLICSNDTLHESVIMYEAIDLHEIYIFFKHLGYRFDPKDMRTFFDRRSIIFRYDLTASSKQNANQNVRVPRNVGKRK